MVTPLFKKTSGDVSFKITVRCPTFIHISKLTEKVVAGQMNSYIYILNNNLDEPLQSAYKKLHSTQTALIKVLNDLLMALDDKNVVLLTLLDCRFRHCRSQYIV